jgi:hypothetical protein
MEDFFDSFKKPEKKHNHKIRVVHFKKDPFDIYIGRMQGGRYNKWAYPKELRESFPKGTPRKKIVDAYEEYLLSNEELMNSLCELKDKVLGCWCKNEGGGGGKSCHGDILAKWVKKKCN